MEQELLICVQSAIANQHIRQKIRETWGDRKNQKRPDVKVSVYFFVGDSPATRSEHAKFNDLVIIPAPYEDKFETIWMKTAAIHKFGYKYFQARGGTGDSARR